MVIDTASPLALSDAGRGEQLGCVCVLLACYVLTCVVASQGRGKTTQMYLNTSPNCFEGPRGWKILFRGPGPENRLPVLLTVKYAF